MFLKPNFHLNLILISKLKIQVSHLKNISIFNSPGPLLLPSSHPKLLRKVPNKQNLRVEKINGILRNY